jgi:hypothetical protein
VRDYTVESQFFHYPLRWPVTGEVQHVPIAPGITVPYNIMNKPGNVKGAKHEQFDPVEALYMNLGVLHADKFPAHVYRAVVTEARYRALTEQEQAGDGEPPGVMSPKGSAAVLTEVFSATTSTDMAASFNQAIAGYGAVPREVSHRLDIVQETAVNISSYTDLVQAEVIMMPGALFSVEHIDPHAGKGAPDGRALVNGRPDQDIGQVVYMRAMDTYQLEAAFDAHMAGTAATPEGTLMINPESGHFYKYTSHPDPGGRMLDPATGEHVDADGTPGLQFVSETKNYFLGRPLEFPANPARQALWRHPYTADFAKRATKDAIHAAILRGDPIVPFLDDATKNVHHEYFRHKGGFYDKDTAGTGFANPRAQAEAQALRQTKTAARKLSTDVGARTLLTTMDKRGEDTFTAWLAASLLRKPIKMVPIEGHVVPGLPADGLLFDKTYDKVDLTRDPLSPKPEAPLLIGVGANGYYAMRAEEGKVVATHRIAGAGDGRTVGNLLHAIVRAGYADKRQYTERPAATTVVGKPTLEPDARAKAAVAALHEKLCNFAATDYAVLQEAMVEQAAELRGK